MLNILEYSRENLIYQDFIEEWLIWKIQRPHISKIRLSGNIETD